MGLERLRRRGAITDEELPDAIELLNEQHRLCEDLFAEIAAASDGAARVRLIDELAAWLRVHAALEEQIFYPAVKTRETEDLLRDSFEDHLGVQRLLAEIGAAGALDQRLDAKWTLLEQQVEAHVHDEEQELLPLVREQVDRARLRELGRELLTLAADLMRRAPA